MIPFSTPYSNATPTYTPFTPEESSALRRLRARYQENPDTWTEHELAYLQFVRWLAQTGRLAGDGHYCSDERSAR